MAYDNTGRDGSRDSFYDARRRATDLFPWLEIVLLVILAAVLWAISVDPPDAARDGMNAPPSNETGKPSAPAS